MKLVLFRHAEKAQLNSYDPPLSEYGFKQSKKLAQDVFSQKIPRPKALYTSHKIRTQQTFKDTADLLNLKLKATPLLDERQKGESQQDFRRRIQEMLVLLQLDHPHSQDCVFLCTHFDWIEEFLTVVECSTDLLQMKYHSWSPAQWMWFEKSEIWNLEKFSKVEV